MVWIIRNCRSENKYTPFWSSKSIVLIKGKHSWTLTLNDLLIFIMYLLKKGKDECLFKTKTRSEKEKKWKKFNQEFVGFLLFEALSFQQQKNTFLERKQRNWIRKKRKWNNFFPRKSPACIKAIPHQFNNFPPLLISILNLCFLDKERLHHLFLIC